MFQRTEWIAILLIVVSVTQRSASAADLSRGEIADLRALRAELAFLGTSPRLEIVDGRELLVISYWECGDHDLKRLRPLLERSPYPICLDLATCVDFTNAGLDHLAGLATLHILKFGSSDGKGRDLKVLPTLPNLCALELRDDYLKGPELAPIAKLTKLRKLLVASTDLTTVCAPYLKQLTEIEEIEIGKRGGGVQEEYLAAMKGMTKLRKLDVGYETLTDSNMAHVSSFTNLRELRVIGHDVTADGLKALAALKKLEILHVSQCPAMSKEGLELVKGLTELRELSIVRGEIPTKAALANLNGLTKLKRLRLDTADDDSLAALAMMTGLEELDLSYTKISDEGLKHLAGLTNLRRLELEYTRITDTGLKQLAELRKLEYLQLSRTAVTDAGLAALSGLKEMRTLDLSQCKITGAGLQPLTGLKYLQDLRLEQNPLTDAATPALKGMIGLTYLSLSRTQVSDRAVLDIKSALPATRVSHAATANAPASKKEEPGLPKDLAQAPADFSLTALQYHEKGDIESERANRQFRNKVFEVTGEIEYFIQKNAYHSYLSLKVDGKVRGLRCSMAAPQSWTKYSPGQTVTLKGTWDELLRPQLARCVITTAKPADQPTLTADELAKDCTALGPAAATEKYRGRWIALVGEVADSGETDAGSPRVVMKTEMKIKVEAVFATFNRDVVATPENGQNVTIRGCVRSINASGVELFPCVPFAKK